jgi:hypothetical protein
VNHRVVRLDLCSASSATLLLGGSSNRSATLTLTNVSFNVRSFHRQHPESRPWNRGRKEGIEKRSMGERVQDDGR